MVSICFLVCIRLTAQLLPGRSLAKHASKNRSGLEGTVQLLQFFIYELGIESEIVGDVFLDRKVSRHVTFCCFR